MVNVTQPRWQDVPVGTGREVLLPTAAGAVEVQFRSDVLAVDPAVCRIIVLDPRSATADVPASRTQPTSSTYAIASADYVGIWSSRFGRTEDEVPTWEDAAWQ